MLKHLLLFFCLFCVADLCAQGSGRSMRFNGDNDAVDLGDQVANNCRAIEIWFRPSLTITSALTEPIALIARDFNSGSIASTNEFALVFRPESWNRSGTLSFVRRVNSDLFEIFSDQDEWEVGHWYHVAVTIDPTAGMQMYINGVLQQSQDPSTQAIGAQSGAPTDRVSLAKWGNLNIRYFRGELDEVRLWETSRSQEAIRNNMTRKLTGTEPGLRAYYRFDEDSGDFLLDSSPNGFDGGLLNIDANERVFSSAPIGDENSFLYSNTLSGTSLVHTASSGQQLEINNINSPASGVHIYHVNESPNSAEGLEPPVSDGYFGVFLTAIEGSYDVNIDAVDCTECLSVFTRNDNAILNWETLIAQESNCVFTVTGESSTRDSYRAEYILGSTNFTFSLGADQEICTNERLTLNATTTGATYLWQDGSTAPTFQVTNSGTYWVDVTLNSCVKRDSIVITQRPEIVIDLGENLVICEGETLTLDATNPDASYLWQDGSTGATLLVTAPGVYTVEVNAGGCSLLRSVTITSNDCEILLLMPNAFTPNGDGVNDLLIPIESQNITSMRTKIFNRWGQKIHESGNRYIEWDGTFDNGEPVPTGTYYWSLIATGFQGGTIEMKGTVSIIR